MCVEKFGSFKKKMSFSQALTGYFQAPRDRETGRADVHRWTIGAATDPEQPAASR